MENWEQKFNHVQTPDGSVNSHRQALRDNLKNVKPRSNMRSSAMIATLVLVLGLSGLTVANPNWVRDVYMKITSKEIRFTDEAGREVHIKTVQVDAPAGAVPEDVLKGDIPADMTWTLDPNDPRAQEIMRSGEGLQRMMFVEGEVTGEPLEGEQRMELRIEDTGDGEFYILNGDTLRSQEAVDAVMKQHGVVQKTFKSLEGEPTDDPTIETMSSEESQPLVASNFELKQNYPNPFNPTTQIPFELKEAANVTLKVYDLTGREVATLVNGPQSAGSHTVQFDGSGLASGTYLYKLDADGAQLSRTMILMK